MILLFRMWPFTLHSRSHTSRNFFPSWPMMRRPNSGEPKVRVYRPFSSPLQAHWQADTDHYFYSQAASYASSPNPAPFLAYFEATTPASPAKHARLRTALFLQTSSAYDASAAGALLGPHAPLLAPELAIIASKVRALLAPPMFSSRERPF